MGNSKIIVITISWYFIIQGIQYSVTSWFKNGRLDIATPVWIIAGIGLLKLKNWARMLGIVLCALNLLLSVVLISCWKLQAIDAVFILIASAFIIYILWHPDIKEQFSGI